MSSSAANTQCSGRSATTTADSPISFSVALQTPERLPRRALTDAPTCTWKAQTKRRAMKNYDITKLEQDLEDMDIALPCLEDIQQEPKPLLQTPPSLYSCLSPTAHQNYQWHEYSPSLGPRKPMAVGYRTGNNDYCEQLRMRIKSPIVPYTIHHLQLDPRSVITPRRSHDFCPYEIEKKTDSPFPMLPDRQETISSFPDVLCVPEISRGGVHHSPLLRPKPKRPRTSYNYSSNEFLMDCEG